MPIEIVSHPLCPFAQRLVLIALSKGWTRDAQFKVTYLDLRTLRETVGAHSPSGEVPALKVGGVCSTTTTEHAAEYLDGLSGPPLLPPSNPALRLVIRERERRVRTLLETLRQIFTAQSDVELDAALSAFFGQIAEIDRDLAADATDETTARMDMIALAPVFSLTMFHSRLREHPNWDAVPRLRDIARRAAALPLVMSSRCPNYGAEFATFFAVTQSIFPARFMASPSTARKETA